jgi:hypothetical protein
MHCTKRVAGVVCAIAALAAFAAEAVAADAAKDVAAASDALIVLMTYQGRGYSLLSF